MQLYYTFQYIKINQKPYSIGLLRKITWRKKFQAVSNHNDLWFWVIFSRTLNVAISHKPQAISMLLVTLYFRMVMV